MRFFKKHILLLLTLLCSISAWGIGWPYAFEGVMLQAFYWDSYQTETKWTKLEARSDELSKSFKILWVPNSGKSSGGLGYIPIYWFTNHNSDMGSEKELRSMIKTYKQKGTDIIADFVINHRGGVSNWTDFPKETWNGQTWQIGPDGICCDDEVAWATGQAKPTGAPDEGENFDGARDLDHTNANVQNNCKNYAKCLLEDFGYAGFRLDMVKGYAGYYTKMYNQYAKPTYSVGEYWDGSYDALAAWIESTGGESAAFDFAFKYAVNEAFASGDMTKLVWYENGVTPKPAGLIHHWYQQLAVTFIDNHDTFRDDWNKFQGNWAAANAFMICSPGTPCVFLPHWNACGDQIARMIEARNGMGVTNTSDVRVLQSDHDCYMAEVTGTKGKLVVKIGPAMVSPQGYSDSQIHCYGEDYCIWTSTKVNTGGGGDDNVTMPSALYTIGDLKDSHWATNKGVKMTREGNKYTAKNVELSPQSGLKVAYFSFSTAIGTSGSSSEWDAIINKSDRYGATSKDEKIVAGTPSTVKKFNGGGNASSAYAWQIEPGIYDITVDFASMKVTLEVADDGEDHREEGIPGETLLNFQLHLYQTTAPSSTVVEFDRYGVAEFTVGDSSTLYQFRLSRNGKIYTCYHSSTSDTRTATSEDVMPFNKLSDVTNSAHHVKFHNEFVGRKVRMSVIPTADGSDFKGIKFTDITDESAVNAITVDLSGVTEYYNLQGVKIDRPRSGSICIERRAGVYRKVLIK